MRKGTAKEYYELCFGTVEQVPGTEQYRIIPSPSRPSWDELNEEQQAHWKLENLRMNLFISEMTDD